MTATTILSLFALLGFAPALPGIANRVKSMLTGRRGAPVLQLYADLWKLSRKGVVYSPTTTIIFRLGPVVLAGTTLLAACILPLSQQPLAWERVLTLGPHERLPIDFAFEGAAVAAPTDSRTMFFAVFDLSLTEVVNGDAPATAGHG